MKHNLEESVAQNTYSAQTLVIGASIEEFEKMKFIEISDEDYEVISRHCKTFTETPYKVVAEMVALLQEHPSSAVREYFK